MVAWARAAGYAVVTAGRGTRMYPDDPTGLPEEAFARYGFDLDIVERRRFNPRMYNSFRDGSKAQIEMCALANATGLLPDKRGMHEPSAGYTDLPNLFRPRAEGGLLARTGVVDLANAVAPDGRSLMPNEITSGVWVVVTTEQPLLHEDLPFYGLPASSDKRYAAFWRPYHLCGIETPMSIAEAALFGRPTAAVPGAPVADVVAVAKRDLRPGDKLDGSGGALVRGQIERVEVALDERLLPLGLADGVELTEPVAAGQPIPRRAVADPTGLVAELRLEHEALARRLTTA
jgi:predicted homoserine dehydrogenase-like protein